MITLKIDGTLIDWEEESLTPKSLAVYRKGSYPTFLYQRRGGALETGTDPYLGKKCEVFNGSTRIFNGEVVMGNPDFTELGWVYTYQAFGQRFVGDRFPFVNENDGMDRASFNYQATNPLEYNPARAGRTVGEILQMVLEWDTNAANLAACGISVTSDTLADLAAITHIPPRPVVVQGDKLLSALESFLSSQAPNHALWIDPDTGALRFMDLRAFDPITLTAGTYAGSPPNFSHDVSDCFQALLIKGQPWAVAAYLSLSNGGLVEGFGYTLDGVTVSSGTAKATFDPANYQNLLDPDSKAMSQGSCVVNSTTTITLNPDDNSQFWSADYWDQTESGRKGVLLLRSSTLPGVTKFANGRIINNDALTAGGTCQVTIDLPLTETSYDSFKLYGTAGGKLNTYRKYLLDPDVADHIADMFSFPQPFYSSVSAQVGMQSTAYAAIVHDGQEVPAGSFILDKEEGAIYFDKPTYLMYNADPDDVVLMVPVNTAVNQVRIPASGFEGTSHTDLGMENTLVICVYDWIDPLNKPQIEEWGQNLLDSLKDTQISGQIEYWGKLESVLSMGKSVNFAGSDWTTGYESSAIPVVECTLIWDAKLGVITQLGLSNRRNAYGAEDFMQPGRPFATGVEDGSYFNAATGSFDPETQANTETTNDQNQRQTEDLNDQLQEPEQDNQEVDNNTYRKRRRKR